MMSGPTNPPLNLFNPTIDSIDDTEDPEEAPSSRSGPQTPFLDAAMNDNSQADSVAPLNL